MAPLDLIGIISTFRSRTKQDEGCFDFLPLIFILNKIFEKKHELITKHSNTPLHYLIKTFSLLGMFSFDGGHTSSGWGRGRTFPPGSRS